MPNTPLWLLQGFFHGSLFQGMNFISWEPSLENWCPLRSNLCPAESMEQGVSHSYWSPDLGWPPVSRSVAKQNSWLKELEIKGRVAGHTACRHSLNETCQTSQGALARVCLWSLRNPALRVLPEEHQVTSDSRSGSTQTQRVQPATRLWKAISWYSIWHRNASLFAKINSFFFFLQLKRIHDLCQKWEYLKS